MAAVCEPFNGEELKWHAVTPAMSNMRYHGDDCAKELKKPSITAFFKPKQGEQPLCKVQAGHTGMFVCRFVTVCMLPALNIWCNSFCMPKLLHDQHLQARQDVTVCCPAYAAANKLKEQPKPTAKAEPPTADLKAEPSDLAASPPEAGQTPAEASQDAAARGAGSSQHNSPHKRPASQTESTPNKKAKAATPAKGQAQIKSFFTPNSK